MIFALENDRYRVNRGYRPEICDISVCCKLEAIAALPTGSRVYSADSPGSTIRGGEPVVLTSHAVPLLDVDNRQWAGTVSLCVPFGPRSSLFRGIGAVVPRDRKCAPSTLES